MKKRAFTLIEVLIATLIASIAAVAALNMGLQSIKVGERLKDKQRLSAPIMIAALHGAKEHSNLERTLESMLSGAYRIDNERLKKRLEAIVIFYEEDRQEGWDLIGDMIGSGYDLPSFAIVQKRVALNEKKAQIYTIIEEK
ncbi:MAG: prepilin-type N-terminal cleavage/methylation domain-containing protein [Helicobacteraceae bacterium]|jgi:prepilin-type N-terminal cleavage/methylation domain-containing protein|nr:prepilin-type N-terminal cleavage/methylation domain-containing protein [Helicobacteraceae bacterium]